MTLETTFQNFHMKFLNDNFTVDEALDQTNFLGYVLCNLLEGKMSQNFDLGPGNVLYYVENLKKYFSSIFHILCHRNETRT